MIKIKRQLDGSLKFFVINALGKEISTISAKSGKFNKIEKRINNKNETVEVIHSAWGNNFYHEDVKYVKFPNGRKIDETYIETKFQEKQRLRSLIKTLLKKYPSISA